MTRTLSAQKVLFIFFSCLLVGFLLAFTVHSFLMNNYRFAGIDNRMLVAYGLNFLLASLIFLTMFFLRKKHKNEMGFLFLFGSLLKFAVFFVIFIPYYQSNSSLSKPAVMTFFIPYLIGLLTETWGLIKLLNLPEKKY